MNDQGDCELDFSDSLRSMIAHHILQTMKVDIDSMTYYGKNFFLSRGLYRSLQLIH